MGEQVIKRCFSKNTNSLNFTLKNYDYNKQSIFKYITYFWKLLLYYYFNPFTNLSWVCLSGCNIQKWKKVGNSYISKYIVTLNFMFKIFNELKFQYLSSMPIFENYNLTTILIFSYYFSFVTWFYVPFWKIKTSTFFFFNDWHNFRENINL